MQVGSGAGHAMPRGRQRGPAPAKSEKLSEEGAGKRQKTVRVTGRQHADYEQLANPETFRILQESLRRAGYVTLHLYMHSQTMSVRKQMLLYSVKRLSGTLHFATANANHFCA